MFVMTEAAGGYLSAVLQRANVGEETAIRLEIDGERLVSKLDTPRPGDATFDHDGRRVLVMDDGVQRMLVDARLEVQDTEAGERLVLVS